MGRVGSVAPGTPLLALLPICHFDGSGAKLLGVCIPQRCLKTGVSKPPGG